MYGHLKMQHRTVLQQLPAIGISHTLAPYELLAEGHVDSAGIVMTPPLLSLLQHNKHWTRRRRLLVLLESMSSTLIIQYGDYYLLFTITAYYSEDNEE